MAAVIDLTKELAIALNANYQVIIRLCNNPDLTNYDCYSQVFLAGEVILSFRTEVLSNDTFRLYLEWDDFTQDILPGSYEYDVLFVNKPAVTSDRFYPVVGTLDIVNRLSEVI